MCQIYFASDPSEQEGRCSLAPIGGTVEASLRLTAAHSDALNTGDDDFHPRKLHTDTAVDLSYVNLCKN